MIQLRLRRSSSCRAWEFVAVEHEPFEEGREFGVRVEREHVRNVLVRPDDELHPLAVDTAQVKDVETAAVRRVASRSRSGRTSPCAAAEATEGLCDFFRSRCPCGKIARTSMTLSMFPFGVNRHTGDCSEFQHVHELA